MMLTNRRKPSIVAVIASLRDFAELAKLPAESFDLCELRLDLLYRTLEEVEALSQGVNSPKIATVRDPGEGGANALPEVTRVDLFDRWLPHCDLIDVEFRNLDQYAELIQRAESAEKEVIISFHDFVSTPPIERLQKMLDSCALSDGRIFKVATNVSCWQDIEVLIRLVQRNATMRVAAVGMGEFGKLSRLVLPRLGSALVYGSLSAAVASGQWPVAELARILAEI
jgi:3-dehydroquinate dehydratase-1